MAADFDALVGKLDAATTAIGEKIQKLVEQLQATGLSEAEEDRIHGELSAIADRLVDMGTDPTNPVPPEPPTP